MQIWWLYILWTKVVHWRDDKWKKINKGEQKIGNSRKEVTALLRLFIFHQNLPALMRVCQHVAEVEHPSVWQEVVSECVFSPKQSSNQLWRKHLFLPPFSLPCYSLHLLTLTSSTLKLPHCWCSGSTFPNINLTYAFSCFHISPSFFSSSSVIPSSKAHWYKPCGCRPERWCWFGHVSNTGQAFWKKSPARVAIWMCWEMRCNAWAVSELITACRYLTGKVHTVGTHWCPVLFHFSYDSEKQMPSWNKLVVQMVFRLKSQLPEKYFYTLIYLTMNTDLNLKPDSDFWCAFQLYLWFRCTPAMMTINICKKNLLER